VGVELGSCICSVTQKFFSPHCSASVTFSLP